MEGQRDPDAADAQRQMSKMIGKAMSETLNDHNTTFINSLTNAMKEVIHGRPVDQRGPSYTN